MTGRNLWGYWDCEYCGRTKIRGDNDECPSCNATRGKNVKFYMDKGNIEYVDESQKNNKANWICPYCNSQNENNEDVCEYCGATKNESKEDYFGEINSDTDINDVARTFENDTSSNKDNIYNTDFDDTVDRVENSINNLTDKLSDIGYVARKGGIIAVGILLFALIIGFIVWLVKPIQREITIESFAWERSIAIEIEKTFDESGWSLPSGAKLQYEKEEIRSYNKVIDHYEEKSRQVKKERFLRNESYVAGYKDLGNGQFKEIVKERPVYETYYETEYYKEPVYKSVPVYDTKYYYKIDRWVKSRTVESSGSDKEPYWGEVNLSKKERQGSKNEAYYIFATFEEEQKRYSLDFSEWENCNEGDILEVKVNRLTNDIVEVVGIVPVSEK